MDAFKLLSIISVLLFFHGIQCHASNCLEPFEGRWEIISNFPKAPGSEEFEQHSVLVITIKKSFQSVYTGEGFSNQTLPIQKENVPVYLVAIFDSHSCLLSGTGHVPSLMGSSTFAWFSKGSTMEGPYVVTLFGNTTIPPQGKNTARYLG